ncbi:MAG: acyl-CoA dehydrogenase [Bacteriovoracaceae bacterium]|jgi:alkylation response protein AidB-like acyl-CoA dehydrogenase|nr:acyl-CoA dehydrogenase [Bacteriovoracaceae bacterium]
MAEFSTDLTDINYLLFNWLKVQDHIEDYEANDLKDIISQFDNFVEKEIWPSRVIGDVDGCTLKDGNVTVPEAFKKANKLFYDNGWYGLGFPEEIGGMPVPHALTVACTAILVGANVSFSMYYGLSKAAMNVILEVGTDKQKSLYVEQMMTGNWGGTMCLTEAGAGSDVGAAKTIATPQDNGTFNMKGTKIFISSGDNDLYDNIIHLVLARTPGSPEGTKGLSLFIVPKNRINEDISNGESNNVVCTNIEEKMGMHGSSTCELTFGNEGDCIGELIGKEHDGMTNMFIMMNEARLLCGSQGDSQANQVLTLTEQYANERVQFDTPIINLPDVKRMVNKMRAMCRGTRALSLYAAHLFDMAKKDPSVESEIAFLTPVCKAFATEEGSQVCVDAIQVHGGYGYCKEYGIEQFFRDTKISTIYEGTTGIQALDFLTRKVLKDGGKTFMTILERTKKSISKARTDWPKECELMEESIAGVETILVAFAVAGQNKNNNYILDHCTDFLHYCGNILVSWLLLDLAILAKQDSELATGDHLKYLKSKVLDFEIFSQHFLVRNKGIYATIMNFSN